MDNTKSLAEKIFEFSQVEEYSKSEWNNLIKKYKTKYESEEPFFFWEKYGFPAVRLIASFYFTDREPDSSIGTITLTRWSEIICYFEQKMIEAIQEH